MLDRIFRVKAGGAALKPQPGQGCSDLVMLPEGQAVARLDYTLYDGWYLVFVDTPGEGLYLGYIHEGSVQPIEALALGLAGSVPRPALPCCRGEHRAGDGATGH